MPNDPTDLRTVSSSSTDGFPSPPSWSRIPGMSSPQAAAVIACAAAGGLLIWAAAVPLAGLELEVAGAGQRVGPTSIIIAALVAGVAAWLLLALLSRLAHGRTVWTVVGSVVLLLSLAGPAISGAGGAVLVVLELMHVVVGVVLLLGLRRRAAPRRGAGRTVGTESS